MATFSSHFTFLSFSAWYNLNKDFEWGDVICFDMRKHFRVPVPAISQADKGEMFCFK